MLDHIDHGVLGPAGKKTAGLFFIVGVIGALGLRLVLILNHYNTTWGAIAWYIAMVAYLIFYFHRLRVEKKRRALIQKEDLINKMKTDNLSQKDKENILKLLNSLLISKLNLNFLILTIMTIAVLAFEIALGLLKIA